MDEQHLIEVPQDPQSTKQYDNTETETDCSSNCNSLPKYLANPCDDTDESNENCIDKEEGQHLDLNEAVDVFITYQ